MFLCHLCLCLMRFQFVSQSLIIQDIALHRKKTVCEKKIYQRKVCPCFASFEPGYCLAQIIRTSQTSFSLWWFVQNNGRYLYFQFQFQILLILFTGSIWNWINPPPPLPTLILKTNNPSNIDILYFKQDV